MTVLVRVLQDGWTWVAVWLLTRAYMAYLFRTTSVYITGDVAYYFQKASNVATAGMAATLPEYPTPVVWFMQALRALTGDDLDYFIWLFAGVMLALDALFAWLVWREGGRYRILGTATWILFLLLLGPLAYCRFDLVPGVLAGAAALWARRRPATAGALVGGGAALKLWPALLVIPLLAKTMRKPALLGLGGVGMITAALAWLSGGWTRLISPLVWQNDRGLQVESIPATWLMFARATAEENRWIVGMSKFNAFEVWGPGATETLEVAKWLAVVGYLAIAVLAWKVVRNPQPTGVSVAVTMFAIVAVMTVTNKTLSPQYLIWFGGPLVAALVALGARSRTPEHRLVEFQVLVLTFITLVVSLLTQIVYPLTYKRLVDSARGEYWPAMALVGRNIVLVGLTCIAWFLAWQLAGQRDPAPLPQSRPRARRTPEASATSGSHPAVPNA